MKRIILILLSTFFITSSCSIDNNSDDFPNQNVVTLWHLVKVTGGLSGVNDEFSLNTIVWTFDEINSTVTIENNNTDDGKEDSLDSGTYNYSIIETETSDFLVVDGIELGELSFISYNFFEINENETYTGPLADGFIYRFQKTLVNAE